MKTKPRCTGALAVAAGFLLTSMLQAGVVHRYSFNETTGTTVDDSVGTADGVIKGYGAFFTGGTLEVPGVQSDGVTLSSSADAADLIAGYVDLPNGIISVLPAVTLETWVTWKGSRSWERVFDLGTSAGGEDVANGNGAYLFLSPRGDVNLRFAVRDPVTGAEPTQITGSAPQDLDVEVCLTATYDPAANVARFFKDGVLIGSGTATIPLSSINDVNNWLGRSQWGDPMFIGAYNEFRVYNNALNPIEVAASFLSGSATPSTDAAVLGAVQAVHLNVPQTAMVQDDEQDFTATVDFAQLAGISLSGVSGSTFESSAPTVATIGADGKIKALAPGNANVSLTYGGQTDSVAITVTARQTGVAVAGTLFVDLRASELSTDRATWPNRATTGDFFAEGDPEYAANYNNTGLPAVVFSGNDAYAGPATTPDLDGGSDRSIEVWAYNPYAAQDETLVAWGHRGGAPDGSNMAFGYGANGTYGAAGHWGSPDMGWGAAGRPLPGRWHYLVYTYDGAVGRVYADGVLKYSETLSPALATHQGFQIRVGAQGNTVGDATDFGQALSGAISMVRVHTGTLSANDVKNNFLYGVELTAAGALQSVNVTLDTNRLYGVGTKGYTSVRAGYANRNYLFVNDQCAFSSSNVDVATIDPVTGVIIATGLGTTTITARYENMDGTAALEVAAVPTPVGVVHRYSFSETNGVTTVEDSVGNADGVIKGNGAAFDGAGKLTLPGGTASNADAATIAGYVDLPNGIISVLTDATFESWVTWNTASDWQRIFDFGRSDGGEDLSNNNGDYIFLSPQRGGGGVRFAFRDVATGTEPVVVDWPTTLPLGEEVHVAFVYNQRANTSQFYSNAVQVATGIASVPLKTLGDVNNWLGRSQWGDAMFAGTFNEFRIWDKPLSAAEVAASLAAGPDNLPATSPTLTANYSTAGSIQLTFTGGVLVSSDAVNGAYTPVAGATSPFTVTTTTGTKFFQIRNP